MHRIAFCSGLLASVVAGSLLSGCATLGTSRHVSVSVVNVVPTQASLLETSVALTLRVTNESPQPLALSGGVHRLYLNDSYVGRAVSNERLAVPALGTTTQTVTVFVENLTLVRKFAELSNKAAPRIAYRLESKLHAVDGSVFGAIKAVTSGELDLAGLMEMRQTVPIAR